VNAEFRLPDLGEGLPEAEIVRWLVGPGEQVELNQPIAEVETAKAVVELPSPFAGIISRLAAAEGEVLGVGEVLVVIDVTAADAAADPGGSARDEEEPDQPLPNLVGYGAAPRRTGRPQRRRRVSREGVSADTAVLEAAPHDVLPPAPPEPPAHERPRSTPPVRKLAKELGVDLALVEASGVAGVIGRADVEAYAERLREAETRSPGTPAAPTTDRETRLPIRGVRKLTAKAMVTSAFTAPHVTCFLEVDVTATTRLLEGLRTDGRGEGSRIGILAVVAKAVCLALVRHGALNSRWDEAAGEIVQFHYVNLGVAVATDRGLIVPNIADADRLGLPELADELGQLAAVARSGRASLSSLTGGTFSITNFGVFGVDAGTPILNPGEAGILGIGAVRRRPWEHRGRIALRDVMTLSLSFDHRLVDGEQGSRFLAEVGDVLCDPGRTLLLV